MHSTKKVKITRVSKEESKTIYDTVIAEASLRIFVNEEEVSTIICTPESLIELAMGYLFSEGIIKRREDILSFSLDEKTGTIKFEIDIPDAEQRERHLKKLIIPECQFNIAPKKRGCRIESRLFLTPETIKELMKKATLRSRLYLKTGGVHSAALCTEKDIILFYEDIGRHNAIDKILGGCLLDGITTHDRILITSGRVSSGTISKAINAEIPVLISSSAPTVESIRLAGIFGVTLLGFARGQRFNIYSNEWRIKS
ncbi:MAG: formate dehydrogenase accessory sulfurtransferase FdhD [Spirochaetota bacterium]